MKKKIILTSLAVMLMSQNVFADNCDDLVTTWKSLYSTIQGKQYTQSVQATVTTPEEWETAIVKAYSSLSNSITLQIANFNETDFDLAKLKNYDVSISAKGIVSTADFSTITYSFDYNPNYKIARAVEVPAYFNKLDLEQKEAYNILYTSTHQLVDNLATDYEKEVAIHNFITNNFSYGPLNTSDVPQRAHSITGLVLDGQGICEAYANTFYVMCKIAGLNAGIITGTLNNVSHMWNQIELDGEWYHVDTSSDDPSPDVVGRERYTFFNNSDDIMSQTHAWERSDFPACTSTTYNYYALNNFIVHSEEELKTLINEQLNNGKTFITFRTEGYTIPNVEVIKGYTSNKGFYTVNITGEYGKESTYNITLK